MMKIFATLALIGLAIAVTAYFFIYVQPGDWLYTHKDWLGIVSSLIAITTPVVILFSVILRKEKDKDQLNIKVNAGRDVIAGNQINTFNQSAEK